MPAVNLARSVGERRPSSVGVGSLLSGVPPGRGGAAPTPEQQRRAGVVVPAPLLSPASRRAKAAGDRRGFPQDAAVQTDDPPAEARFAQGCTSVWGHRWGGGGDAGDLGQTTGVPEVNVNTLTLENARGHSSASPVSASPENIFV